MNLSIDIGNSSTKLAIFDQGKLKKISKVNDGIKFAIQEILEKNMIDRVIISGVTTDYIQYSDLVDKLGIPVITLSSKTSTPFKINYSNPETIGPDRIAGIAAAYNKYNGNNVLVIDAGTAVTYDFLSSNNEYPGGNISPGLGLRFKALNEYTGLLPLVSYKSDYEMVGRNTEEAIRAGVQMGLVFEINEYIRSFKNKYKEIVVIITGGDGEFLAENIDYPVIYEPNLIVEGLNFLLAYNA